MDSEPGLREHSFSLPQLPPHRAPSELLSSIPAQKKKSNPKKKSKSWKPHDPLPMDDFDFSSNEEEENEEGEVAKMAQDPPSAEPENLSVQPISQKRNHESSTLDSDKEISQSSQLSLQIMPAQQPPPEWVKVCKKKGKKCRIVDSSHGPTFKDFW